MQWWNNRRGRSDDSPLVTGVSSREERLSLYLDDDLPAEDLADIEAELERDSDLRSALEGMAFVRDALREIGSERAPRSFTLVSAQAPRSMRRGYRGGVPRFEVMTRVATAVAAFGLTLAVGAPMLTTMVGGGNDEGASAGATADNVAMSAATAESPEAELFQTTLAPEGSPVPEGQPPSADAPANGQGGDAGGAGGPVDSGGGESEERETDPNGTPAEASLRAAADDDSAASDDGLEVLQIAQFGLAGLTGALLLATGGLYFMRKRGIGFFR